MFCTGVTAMDCGEWRNALIEFVADRRAFERLRTSFCKLRYLNGLFDLTARDKFWCHVSERHS